MKKKDVVKLAMIGLALGSAITSCSTNSGNGQADTSGSEKGACGSDCSSSKNDSTKQNDPSTELKGKREAAAEGILKK